MDNQSEHVSQTARTFGTKNGSHSDQRKYQQTCSEESDVRWLTAAHESIFGVKWFMIALCVRKTKVQESKFNLLQN